MNVYAALAAVMADVDHVAKRERNTQGRGFMFRGIDTVLNAVGPALRNHGVIVVPTVQEYHYSEILAGEKRTPMGQARLIVSYTFYGPDGDSVTGSAAGEAFDSGDKATAKAMSVAFRTVLLQALTLPTDEPDPDSQTYERAEPRPVEYSPLAEAKARAWTVAKRLRPMATDDERIAFTAAALEARGSSIADADADTWNALADDWESF